MATISLGLMLWYAAAHAAERGLCPARPDTDAVPAGSSDSWSIASDRDEVCVYTRNAPGSNVHEIMAVAAVAAPPKRVLEVITDYEAYPDFMPYVSASRVLKADGPRRWVFQQLSFPFPISDRYYTIVIEADARGAALGRYRLFWRLAGDAEPRQQGVGEPTRVNNGSWELRPLGERAATQVTYMIHTDPGGALPAFVVNMANTVAVPLVIEKVRARAAAGMNPP